MMASFYPTGNGYYSPSMSPKFGPYPFPIELEIRDFNGVSEKLLSLIISGNISLLL